MPAIRTTGGRSGPALGMIALALTLLAACTTTTGGTPQRAGGAGASALSATSSAPAGPGTTGASGSRPITPIPPVPPAGSTPATGPSQPAGSTPATGPSQPVTSSRPVGPTSPAKPSGPTDSAGSAQWVFIVVRHAERADDGTDDPPLTDAGDDRADRLADLLQPLHGVGVYASAYRRTQATAMPTSVVWDVPVTTYDATDGPDALLAQVVLEHPSGAVLIVGHSDTVPGIVHVLCGCAVDPIADDDFGRLYEVALDANGAVVDFQALDHY